MRFASHPAGAPAPVPTHAPLDRRGVGYGVRLLMYRIAQIDRARAKNI